MENEKIKNYLLDPGKLPCGGFSLGGGIVYDEETKTVGIPTVYIYDPDDGFFYISTLKSFVAPILNVCAINHEYYNTLYAHDVLPSCIIQQDFRYTLIKINDGSGVQVYTNMVSKDSEKVHIEGIPVPMYKLKQVPM